MQHDLVEGGSVEKSSFREQKFQYSSVCAVFVGQQKKEYVFVSFLNLIQVEISQKLFNNNGLH